MFVTPSFSAQKFYTTHCFRTSNAAAIISECYESTLAETGWTKFEFKREEWFYEICKEPRRRKENEYLKKFMCITLGVPFSVCWNYGCGVAITSFHNATNSAKWNKAVDSSELHETGALISASFKVVHNEIPLSDLELFLQKQQIDYHQQHLQLQQQ